MMRLILVVVLLVGCKKDNDNNKDPDSEPFMPEVIWEVTLDDAITAPITVGFDGTLFAGAGKRVIALNPDSGKVIWEHGLASQRTDFTPVGNDGNLLIPDGTTLSLVDHGGVETNTIPLPGTASGAAAIGGDGAAIVGLVNGVSQVVSANNWTTSLTGPSNLVVGENGLILAYHGGRLSLLSSATGAEAFSIGAGSDVWGGVGENGLLLAGAHDRTLTGIDALTGEETWSNDIEVRAESAVMGDGAIYVGTDSGITSLNDNNGKVGFKTSWGGAVGTPVLDDALGMYALDEDGVLAYIDRISGDVVWTWDAGATGQLALTDDALYVATTAGTVTAIEVDAGLCKGCLWPRIGHDNRGTGRAGAPIQ